MTELDDLIKENSPHKKLELVSPFPSEFYPNLLEWVQQYPLKMMDDSWPKDLAGLSSTLDLRSECECTALVTENGKPVGFIGYQDLTSHVGSLRGVCFDKAVHGNGTAFRALRVVLQRQFDRGIHKIMAFPFADNPRSVAFYYKLGAKYEGLLKEHTKRNGLLTDMLCLAFFAKDDAHQSKYGNFI
jgi:RimJ/RimL family protein N-acetyltransferase